MTDLAPTGLDKAKGYAAPPSWAGLAGSQPADTPPALLWPQSVVTFEQMATDATVQQVLNSIILPILQPTVALPDGSRVRGRWCLKPNGGRDEVVAHCATDLALPVAGQPAPTIPRSRGRFSYREHLRQALRIALVHGFAPFEQEGEVVFTGSTPRWHLRRLGARPPDTVSDIKTSPDGGLLTLEQLPPGFSVGAGFSISGVGGPRLYSTMQVVPIPVTSLVWYAHDMAPGKWMGRSLLRPAYRPWLVKDRLIRVDAVKHERNGMGVPQAEAPPNATPGDLAALEQIAMAWRAGEYSSAAVPHGARIRLTGVEGSLPDTLASIRFCNEEIAGIMLGQFLKLGQTETGSRALGGTFVDFFHLALDSLVAWVGDVGSEHVVEDLVDWNWGADEPAPRVGVEVDPEFTEDAPVVEDTAEGRAPSEAVQKVYLGVGTVVTADEARQIVNAETGTSLPVPGPFPATPPPEPAPAPPPFARGVRATTTARLPSRELRRQPYAHEVAAAADFEAMEATFLTHQQQAVDTWQAVRQGQVDELVAEVEALIDSGDLAGIANITATADGGDELLVILRSAAEESIETAVQEAADQGITFVTPSVDDLSDALALRAQLIEDLMARSLADSAARAAVRNTSPGLDGSTVAGMVRSHLEGLTDAYLNDQLGGAVMAAQNEARRAVFSMAPASIYASELLDTATCDRCVDVDGREYETLAEANVDYPTGGFAECRGGSRCRGTLVAVYDEGG